MAKKIKFEESILKSVQLTINNGQMKGLPQNPRFIRDKEFLELKQDMIDDPYMIHIRRVLVIPFEENYIIVAGNMRYRALEDLGVKQIPVTIIPKGTPMKLVRGWAIKDNTHKGNDDWDIYENVWSEFEEEGWAKIRPFTFDDSNKKGSTIRVTIIDVKEGERDVIKQVLTKAGYKVK